MLWVYATLIDTMLRTYSVFVRPLTRAEEQSFYVESRIIATLFGVSSELVPPTLDAFREYFEEMLAGPTLEITPAARSIYLESRTKFASDMAVTAGGSPICWLGV